jgi:hypothetical protein
LLWIANADRGAPFLLCKKKLFCSSFALADTFKELYKSSLYINWKSSLLSARELTLFATQILKHVGIAIKLKTVVFWGSLFYLVKVQFVNEEKFTFLSCGATQISCELTVITIVLCKCNTISSFMLFHCFSRSLQWALDDKLYLLYVRTFGVAPDGKHIWYLPE